MCYEFQTVNYSENFKDQSVVAKFKEYVYF